MAIFSKKPEDKKEDKQEQKAADQKLEAYINLPAVLLQPRVSEKAGALAKLNKYVFTVKAKANKVEVKKAIENGYKVKVVSVNIVNNKGKSRNFGRTAGRTSDLKKAIVTLREGDSIQTQSA